MSFGCEQATKEMNTDPGTEAPLICQPMQVMDCYCANGGSGTAACLPDGSGYGLCENCESSSPATPPATPPTTQDPVNPAPRDPAPADPTPAEPALDDIVDTAIKAEGFTTLVSLVQAADLVSTLKSEGPFTVFAPTDDAFALLPAELVETLNADAQLLTDVLTYHVVSGEFAAANLAAISELKTVNGATISISAGADGSVIINENVKVIIADIECSNGIIHAVDAVIIPPAEEAPVDETPVDETPVDETPVDETPVDETPVDETPVEETPVDETPVEETPVDDKPEDVNPLGDASCALPGLEGEETRCGQYNVDWVCNCDEACAQFEDCCEDLETVCNAEELPVDETPETEVPADTVTFEDIHPVFVKSCSGWACHQYTGFAQADINLAYDAMIEKSFANNIVDAIVDGRMPVGNFGLPLCSGDPAVDTNPKCLTQEEMDLLLAWYANFTGETSEEETPAPVEEGPEPVEPIEEEPEVPAQATFEDVHPVFEQGCSGFFCHSGGLANDNIETAYEAVIANNLCEPILEEISTGSMPLGQECTGDPQSDAGTPGCLTPVQYDLVVSWVTGAVPCPE